MRLGFQLYSIVCKIHKGSFPIQRITPQTQMRRRITGWIVDAFQVGFFSVKHNHTKYCKTVFNLEFFLTVKAKTRSTSQKVCSTYSKRYI